MSCWMLSLILVLFVHGDPIELHNKKNKELATKIIAYEKRVEALVAQKMKVKEGPALDNLLNDISEIQKDLVGIRKSRRQLQEHVQSKHPSDELLEDLSILKEHDHKKTKKSETQIDSRLDEMLVKLRAQYARTDKTQDLDTSEEEQALDISLDNKKKNIEKEFKDEYMNEGIKTKLKVN